jgi:hypothetical protein
LITNRTALKTVVSAPDFIHGTKKIKDQREKIKKLVKDRALFHQFEKAHAILKPVTSWLTHFQSDGAMISDAYHVFFDLKKQFLDLVESNVISQGVYDDYLWPLLLNRWNAGYADVHGLSYLLDPRYQGEGMDEDNVQGTLQVLSDMT